MKKVFLIAIILITTVSGYAQDWQTDFTKAKEIATENDRTIILVFQGSDWCAPCIKLDREIWSTNEFQELSENHFVMLQADFPRKSKNALSKEQQAHNNKLAEKYNLNGYFPYVVVLNSSGKVLGNLGYEKTTPALYFKKLEAFEK
ncbi:thioredoxin family protein [Formosa sp. L2A11]|uniref:thioredoxin family protein n=1 Tax=Formosa sp. L2A11 TaxID=2686363 RepID=UPI00131E341E|nr:thioredoxin family protein [Formosa sp. L2A11]